MINISTPITRANINKVRKYLDDLESHLGEQPLTCMDAKAQLRDFITDQCLTGNSRYNCLGIDLYHAFVDATGIKISSNKMFPAHMEKIIEENEELGIIKGTIRQGIIYYGVTLYHNIKMTKVPNSLIREARTVKELMSKKLRIERLRNIFRQRTKWKEHEINTVIQGNLYKIMIANNEWEEEAIVLEAKKLIEDYIKMTARGISTIILSVGAFIKDHDTNITSYRQRNKEKYKIDANTFIHKLADREARGKVVLESLPTSDIQFPCMDPVQLKKLYALASS